MDGVEQRKGGREAYEIAYSMVTEETRLPQKERERVTLAPPSRSQGENTTGRMINPRTRWSLKGTVTWEMEEAGRGMQKLL